MILLVIDINDSIFELKKKLDSCKKTLSELGVSLDKIIFILNKADLVKKEEILEKIEKMNLNENKKWILVSAITGENITKLKQLIKNVISTQLDPNVTKSLNREVGKIYDN